MGFVSGWVVVLAGALVFYAQAGVTRAGMISIPNASFESPDLQPVAPYAASTIDHWSKAPVPAWWTGAGYPDDQWRDAGGIFLNVDPSFNTPIDNADGDQVAFIFSPPEYELFQDLASTFEAGKSYRLTVGAQGGGYGMQLGVPMEMRLYYRDLAGNRISVGQTVITNTNAGPDQSHLTDYILDIPTVGAGDAWAGKPIGVQLISTATFENSGGFWILDNVRLESVPEPASLLVVALGACALSLRRRRT